MARMFYLSYVYDANGYRRFDMLKNESLVELDKIISNFKDHKEILNKYFPARPKGGRVCIVYEDLDVKKSELAPDSFDEETKNRFEKSYTYAHIIPVLYKNRRLMNIEACLLILKRKLKDPKIIRSIMIDKDKNGLYIKTNKKYIFDTDNEKELLRNGKEHDAIDAFLERIKKASYEEQYFYLRTLIDICELSISTVKTNQGTITLYDGNIGKIVKKDLEYVDIMTDSDRLEKETEDMDAFWRYHDFDEVYRLSPNPDEPIGSIGGKK